MNLDAAFKSIEVSVKYSLDDYYKIIADHVPNAVRENSRKSSALGAWITCKVVPTISCLVAVLNGKLKPTYHFTVSSEGVRRSGGARELFVTWSEIKKVRNYGTNFFMELEKGGALPLPYRFLSKEQRDILDNAFRPE
jgi:hypothetical protein